MAGFLVDASLPRMLADQIRVAGHEATDLRDVGLASAPDSTVAEWARTRKLCLLTRDEGFANILRYPPDQYSGTVVLRVPKGSGRTRVLNLARALLENLEVVHVPAGKPAIVESGRIRIRSA